MTSKTKKISTTIDIEDLVNVSTSKHPTTKIIKSDVISASRRTDIPAFYMDIMLTSMKNKFIDVIQKFGNVSRLSLDPNDVKCIVWWSKNYEHWIECYKNNKQLFDKYKHMFNFTINDSTHLESGIDISLDSRLEQLKYLANTFGSICIKYRFDPIVKWRDIKTTKEHTNFHHFKKIIKFISICGVKEVIFAFCIPYNHVIKHMKKNGKQLIAFTDDEKLHIINKMIEITDLYKIRLSACCSDAIISNNKKIFHSKCVDGDAIETIIHSQLKRNSKDTGQRVECNCATSRDIGSYTMKCNHSCDYCYANPSH